MGAIPVRFWVALAMALTAGVGGCSEQLREPSQP